jgi:hypothetical protein
MHGPGQAPAAHNRLSEEFCEERVNNNVQSSRGTFSQAELAAKWVITRCTTRNAESSAGLKDPQVELTVLSAIRGGIPVGSFTQECVADNGPLRVHHARAIAVRALVGTLSPGVFWRAGPVSASVEDAVGLDWLGRPVCGAFGKRPRLVVERAVSSASRWMTSLRVWPVAVARESSRIWVTMACTMVAAAEPQWQCLDGASSAWPRAGSATKLLSWRILLGYSSGYECSADAAWPA